MAPIAGQVFGGLSTVTMWFLIGGLVLALLALLSGPYRWAVAARSGARRAWQGAGHLVSALAGQASSGATVAWIRRHVDALRIGGAVAAALAVLIFSVNWAGLLVIAVLLALYEYGLHRLHRRQPTTPPPAPAGGPPEPAPAAPDATAGPLTPTGPDGQRPGSGYQP